MVIGVLGYFVKGISGFNLDAVMVVFQFFAALVKWVFLFN